MWVKLQLIESLGDSTRSTPPEADRLRQSRVARKHGNPPCPPLPCVLALQLPGEPGVGRRASPLPACQRRVGDAAYTIAVPGNGGQVIKGEFEVPPLEKGPRALQGCGKERKWLQEGDEEAEKVQ